MLILGCRTQAMAVGVATLTAVGAQGQVFEPLGVPANKDLSSAAAVSADGMVVAGQTRFPGSIIGVPTYFPQAATWTRAGGWRLIQGESTAAGVSADGSVLAGAYYQGWPSVHAATWVGDQLELFGPETSEAFGISADASVVVGYSVDGSVEEATRWTAGGAAFLGHLSGSSGSGRALGVSADGAVIVGADGNRPFRWTAGGGMQHLGPFSGGLSESGQARAVSADHRIIVGDVGDATGQWRAFMQNAYGLVPLPLLPGMRGSRAFSVSSDGSVIVGEAFTTDGVDNTAFVWDRARGMRELRPYLIALGATNLDGWRLATATGVSPDGAFIVGNGIDPDGRQEAWLARVPAFCYADCDGAATVPALNVNDFVCFQTRFASGDPYANCDNSSTPPVLNVNDFLCFQRKFAGGCP